MLSGLVDVFFCMMVFTKDSEVRKRTCDIQGWALGTPEDKTGISGPKVRSLEGSNPYSLSLLGSSHLLNYQFAQPSSHSYCLFSLPPSFSLSFPPFIYHSSSTHLQSILCIRICVSIDIKSAMCFSPVTSG